VQPPAKGPLNQPSEAETTAAIEALYHEPAQLNKLRECGKFFIEGVGRAAEGRDADDLLSEAVTRTLEGTRTWNRAAVDMSGHLIGSMRSIVYHWAESVKARKAVTYLESETIHVDSDDDEVIDTEIGRQRSPQPGPDRLYEVKQQVELIEQAFKDDAEVTQVLEALKAGFEKGQEIQDVLNISPTEYNTRMKRLRRKARVLTGGR
jgi:DNA-directed RNA polymerase specialized sigma24 family protein